MASIRLGQIFILDNIAISSEEILCPHFRIISDYFPQKFLLDINVEIIKYNDNAKLQEDCLKQHKKNGWRYAACLLVPYDAKQKFIVRVVAGDEKTKKHELAHCHGHADTFGYLQLICDISLTYQLVYFPEGWAGTRWSTKRYLNMDLLREMELEKKMAVA